MAQENQTGSRIDLFTLARYAFFGYMIYKALGGKFLVGCLVGYLFGSGKLFALKERAEEVITAEVQKVQSTMTGYNVSQSPALPPPRLGQGAWW